MMYVSFAPEPGLHSSSKISTMKEIKQPQYGGEVNIEHGIRNIEQMKVDKLHNSISVFNIPLFVIL